MIIWIDAQLSPVIARWVTAEFSCEAFAVRDIGLREAEDTEIFDAAKKAKAIVITKDSDFVGLLDRFGPPPQIIWLTCGNTSNAALMNILASKLEAALELIREGASLVEINSPY